MLHHYDTSCPGNPNNTDVVLVEAVLPALFGNIEEEKSDDELPVP